MTQASSVRARELSEIEIFRDGAHTTHQIVRLNADGITHHESLCQPQPAGNCLNWVLGHLICVYDEVLPLLGQKPVMGKEALRRYARGTPPLQEPAEALPLAELMRAWDMAAERVDAGLASLTSEKLNAPAPSSPRDNPNETVRSLLTLVLFHQAYHAGQMGLLRRMTGKEGAIR
jgi:DinB superfamily